MYKNLDYIKLLHIQQLYLEIGMLNNKIIKIGVEQQ